MNITICDVPIEKVHELSTETKILVMRSFGELCDICFKAEFAFKGTNSCFARNVDSWHFETREKFKFDLKPDDIGNVYISEEK